MSPYGTSPVLLMVLMAVSCGSGAPAKTSVGDAPTESLPTNLAPYMVDLVVKAVRDQDGHAIPRAELFISGGNEAFGRWEKRVTTDASGMMRVRLPVGEYRVRPLDSAFASIWSHRISLQRAALVTVRLQPACAISGRVLDDGGRPLGNSRVEIWADQGNIDLVADEQGGFSAGRLSASEHTVTAYASGHAPTTLRLAVRPGEHRRGVKVVLHRGATLTVTANCGGKCLGARVKVSAADETYGEQDVDADGAAVFRDLPAGEVVVRAVRSEALPGEMASSDVKRRLAPGDDAAMVVTLAPTGGDASLRGTVVSKSGKPLYAAIEVNCGGVQRRTTSGNDGSFVVRDLPHDRHCSVIASKDGERTELETDGAAPLRVVINSPANP
jgi:Carboxypeptidase regulatory-like domain